MRRNLCGVLLIALLALAVPSPAAAQQESGELRFSLRRLFGLSWGKKIQGRFSARVQGPDDLVQVEFYLDDQRIYLDEEPPFRYDFSTSQFEPGPHRFYALGLTEDGRRLRSATVEVEILSAAQARQVTVHLLGPLLGLVLLLTVGGMVVVWLLSRRRGAFQLGQYGLAGGAVCRHCGLPFARHFWALNAGLGKLERCPHCGRWSVARRASAEALRQAEQRYRQRVEGGRQPAQREAESLRQLLEESRYESEE